MSNEPSTSNNQPPSLALQREQHRGAFASIIDRINAPPPTKGRNLEERLSSPPSDRSEACVQNQVDECRRLVEETVEGSRTFDDFARSLQALGISSAEAKEYFEEVKQRVELRRKAKGKRRESSTQEPSPNGLEEGSSTAKNDQSDTISESERARQEQRKAVEAAAWIMFQAKLGRLGESADSPSLPSLEQIADALGQPKTAPHLTGIPQATLSAVPHLAHLQSKVSADPYISETWRLRQEYARESALDPLITLGQSQPVKDPVSWAMWKLIILDHFVDFDKLYATLGQGYDQHDEPKDFAPGFSLVKKDVASAKRAVKTESDWCRVFDAWAAGVVVFYPHREEELVNYRDKIVDFCRSIPDGASIAIQFDRDARDRYARHPFRLDDQKQLHVPFLSQVLTVSSSHQTGTKRTSSYSAKPHKKVATICQNWNLGFCNLDSCPGNRRHNICSECRGNHRARDVDECRSKLNLRRQQYRSSFNLDA